MIRAVGILHGWEYCPRCRARLEGDEKRVECPECGFVSYGNPVPTATAVVVGDDGRLLLGRRALEPDKDCWDLLGGFVDEGEHPLDALRRELDEETGLEVEPGAFLGAFIDTYGEGPEATSVLNLVWEARIVSGEPSPADDVSELRWFPQDEPPPPEECAFRWVSEFLSSRKGGRAEADQE